MKKLTDLLIIGFGILLIAVILFYVLLPAGTSRSAQAAGVGGGMSIQTVATATPCAIQVGSNVQVVYPGTINVRLSPGYSNKTESDLLCGGTRTGEQFTVVDGPQVADNLIWWKVSNARCTGWVAERTQQGVLILQDP